MTEQNNLMYITTSQQLADANICSEITYHISGNDCKYACNATKTSLFFLSAQLNLFHFLYVHHPLFYGLQVTCFLYVLYILENRNAAASL